MPLKRAHLQLIEWMAANGLEPVDVAKQLRMAARRHPLIDAAHFPPIVHVRRWLIGGIPHKKYQELLSIISDGAVAKDDWK